ncbi:MAG: glucokinase [Cyanobacteriota bacterium]|nr:glucokinase [Cyanobacteriota bacterium]
MTLLLAGDIGGTKTLLSLYRHSPAGLECLNEARYPSADWRDLAPMVREFLEPRTRAGQPSPAAACFAVAGPVQNGQASLTNLDWQLDERRLAADCGVPRVELVNDFGVLVYGLPHLGESQLAVVRPGQAVAGAPLLVLGAGTGLGVALGVPTAAGLLALPTEGGHGTFAPRTPEEWRLNQWLKADLGVERLSIERVVSGTGLGAVARWLLAERHPDGQDPLWASARAEASEDWPGVVASAAQAGDPLANDALRLWLEAYGSVTGDLALTSLCRGGIWLAGGTAAKQLAGLRSPAFLDAFLAKGRLRPVLEAIPIQAVTDPAVGVFSAACRARMLLG